MFKEGHLDHRNFSNTPTLIRTLLIRVDQLMRVTLAKDVSVDDAYQALGMATELLEEVDRLFCRFYYDQIPEGKPTKSFEELTGKLGKPVKAKSAVA